MYANKGNRLKQLRAFCQVARLGSVTEAGRYIASSQPAVSQQVRKLEGELGATLFQRKGPHLTLTPAGHQLYEMAMPLVARMDRLAGVFADQHRGHATGELDIAVGPTTAESVLPGYLHRLHERQRDMVVNVTVVGDRERVRRLREFEADIAFSAADLPQLDLDFQPVFSSKMVLIAPPGHPLGGRSSVSISEAAMYPAVTPRLADSVCHRGEQYGRMPNRVAEVDGWSEIKRFVEEGIGIAFVPEICVTDLDRVCKIPVAEYARPLVYGMLTRRNCPPSLAAESFVQIVKESATGD